MHITRTETRPKPAKPFYVAIAFEDINVLANLPLFIKHSVAQRRMLPPKFRQNLIDGRESAGQDDLGLAVRKSLQMAAQINRDPHPKNLMTNYSEYAFTQQISGSDPSIIFHESPSS